MFLGFRALLALFPAVAEQWENNLAVFNEIDSEFGDGDHGVTIGKIAARLRAAAGEVAERPLREVFDDLSMAIMGVGGGAAGPLYGTLFSGLGEGLEPDAVTVDADQLKAMLKASRAALASITKAQVGDKTMMDALLPAVAAAEACTGDIPEILRAADEAANEGAEATAGMVSKFGRARSYGDRTIGTPDAGAKSTALLFHGLFLGLNTAE
ncbi:MAG: dihydroxyacetone kinase subunit L [Propionibacteriaceae bacterium]|jgi:dihydroxyacetone kinase-like protein|nr:dihydroxyacetone kinase subunit L [Propionibacteriaceae bacterium]